MYHEYWGLAESPFENQFDAKFLFLSKSHQEGLARLQFVIEQRKQIGLLTGGYGTGKTFLAHQCWRTLHPKSAQICYVGNPLLSLDDMLRFIVQNLAEGTQTFPEDKGGLLRLLEEIMRRNQQIGRHTVILLDDAQLVENIQIFEELRVLLNSSFSNELFLTVILLGQTELHEKISSLPQFKQRVSFNYHLQALDADEVEAYLEHRLKIAGSIHPESIFTPEAAQALWETSKGIPRVINTLSEAALLNGMSREIKSIDKGIVQEAQKEILL